MTFWFFLWNDNKKVFGDTDNYEVSHFEFCEQKRCSAYAKSKEAQKVCLSLINGIFCCESLTHLATTSY